MPNPYSLCDAARSAVRSRLLFLALWRVAASMKPSETLTPEEAARVDQALEEIEAGEFIDWQDLERAL